MPELFISCSHRFQLGQLAKIGGFDVGNIVTINRADALAWLDSKTFPGPYSLRDIEPMVSVCPCSDLAKGTRLTDVFPNGLGAGGGKVWPNTSVIMRSPATLTVDHFPSWMTSADLIIKRGRKTYARSLTRTEPRYRAILRRLRRFFK